MTEYFENGLYESIESVLGLMDCDIGAAECHGILCGMLCGSHHFNESDWLGHTMGYNDDLAWSDLGAGHALTQLLADTVEGFSSDDFSLRVLLPSDDDSLPLRSAALGSWCRGFLSGFGLNDRVDVNMLSDDSQGFLRDLDQIGRVDSAAEEDEEDDEFAFMEICEYARIGVMLLREETLASGDEQEGGGTLH
jgi:uncharacterized protein YgfB (UPF0149 family)